MVHVPSPRKPRAEGALGPGSEALGRDEAEELLRELGPQPRRGRRGAMAGTLFSMAMAGATGKS